jgi:hypothetical protein
MAIRNFRKDSTSKSLPPSVLNQHPTRRTRRTRRQPFSARPCSTSPASSSSTSASVSRASTPGVWGPFHHRSANISACEIFVIFNKAAAPQKAAEHPTHLAYPTPIVSTRPTRLPWADILALRRLARRPEITLSPSTCRMRAEKMRGTVMSHYSELSGLIGRRPNPAWRRHRR